MTIRGLKEIGMITDATTIWIVSEDAEGKWRKKWYEYPISRYADKKIDSFEPLEGECRIWLKKGE